VARYCAVFPISKLINLIFRARGRRADELPHSYQMMLFWAGLRGAVGVALAAGLKGDNGPALRTTVLVVVVLTMVVFGGTTGRMIEIVGIRTGVVEDDDSSDDEGYGGNGLSAYHELPRNGKYAMRYEDPDTPVDSPYRGEAYAKNGAGGRRGSPPLTRRSSQLAHGAGGPIASGSLPPPPRSYSRTSLTSTESDGEGTDRGDSPPSDAGDEPHERHVWRDGQWFNVLDERYLLPVFSNATASRRSATRKALRSKSRVALDQLANDSMASDGGDLASGGGAGETSGGGWMSTPPASRGAAGAPSGRVSSPAYRQPAPPRQPEFAAGLGSVLSSLVGGSTHASSSAAAAAAAASESSRTSPTFGHKRRESGAPTQRSHAADEADVLDLAAPGRRSIARRPGDSMDSASSTGSRGGPTSRPNAFLVDLQDGGGQRSAGT
jgi:sodium/hydrogen exchanger-like protein 6/7